MKNTYTATIIREWYCYDECPRETEVVVCHSVKEAVALNEKIFWESECEDTCHATMIEWDDESFIDLYEDMEKESYSFIYGYGEGSTIDILVDEMNLVYQEKKESYSDFESFKKDFILTNIANDMVLYRGVAFARRNIDTVRDITKCE